MKRLLSALAAILVTSAAALAAVPLFNTTPYYQLTAAAAWTTSSTTITLSSSTPCPSTLQVGSAVNDAFGSTGPDIIGYVASCPAGTTTLTLTAGAQFASNSTADVVRISNDLARYQEPNQILATLNYLISLINTFVTPSQMGSYQTPRNFLDNGAMLIQQRGTSTVTCAANSAPTTTAYGPDRWLCDANVSSGAGQSAPATSTPTPPLGFAQEIKLWRNSGALTQPVCSWQAVPTYQATALQGQSAVFSAYIQALGATAAANTTTLYVITGTGSDEKFLGTSWTASPAITPAWTGIATAGSAGSTTTTGWVRYSVNVQIPTTATEIGVGVCYTPNASNAGSTDGIAFTGAQLEQVSSATAGPGPFEFRHPADELARAYRYLYSVTEPAVNAPTGIQGQSASTTLCSLQVNFPVTMRAVPTFTVFGTALGTSTFKINQAAQNLALASTYLVTLATTTPYAGFLTGTTAASQTAGWGCQLVGGGSSTTTILTWSADL